MLDEATNLLLDQESERLGKPQAVLIRDAIKAHFEQPDSNPTYRLILDWSTAAADEGVRQ